MAILLDGALRRLEDDISAGPNPWVRNTNDPARYDEQKAGTRSVIKVAEDDWRMWWESIQSDQDADGELETTTSYADSPDGIAWTKDDTNNPIFVGADDAAGENDEAAVSSVVWDPVGGRYIMYYHGGNQGGTRRIYAAESTDGSTGKSWSRLNSGNPILDTGGVGDPDEGWLADPKVIRVSASSWVMLYRGVDGSGVSTICRATSSDGVIWTKDTTNSPVIDVGAAGAWDDEATNGPSVPYVDENGRWHVWYVGNDGTDDQVGHAYSDDSGQSFTKGSNNPVLGLNAEADSPDADGAGDVLDVIHDGDKLLVTYTGTTISGYTGGAGSPVRSICAAWLPLEAEATPSTPGRFFSDQSTDRVEMSSGLTLLGSSVFTIVCRFKCYEDDNFRNLYTEEDAFNEQVWLRLRDGGLLEGWFRTPSSIEEQRSSGRFDDNQWHNAAWRRNGTGAANIDLIADGSIVGSDGPIDDGGDPGTATATPDIAYGNWHSNTGLDEPARGTIARIAVWAGAALTNQEIEDFLNDGTLPAAGAPTWWHDPGSGSPETDQSGNGNTGTITGTTVVNADPEFGLTTISSPVSQTSTVSWESRGGVSKSKEVLWEASAVTIASQEAPWESRALIEKPEQVSWASGGRVSGSREVPYEAAGRLEVGDAVPWEAGGEVVASRQVGWEALVLAEIASRVGWESVAELAASRAVPWESGGSAIQSEVSSWEALGRVAESSQVPWESRTPASPVSQTQQAHWEAAGRIVGPRQVGWESLGRIVATRQAPWEALEGLAATKEALWEAGGTVFVTRSVPWEARGRVLATALVPWEALARVAGSQLAYWEAEGRIVAVEVIFWESATTGIVEVFANPRNVLGPLNRPRILGRK